MSVVAIWMSRGWLVEAIGSHRGPSECHDLTNKRIRNIIAECTKGRIPVIHTMTSLANIRSLAPHTSGVVGGEGDEEDVDAELTVVEV